MKHSQMCYCRLVVKKKSAVAVAVAVDDADETPQCPKFLALLSPYLLLPLLEAASVAD